MRCRKLNTGKHHHSTESLDQAGERQAIQSGTMNVHRARAETLIHLSADKIQLNSLAKTGPNALLQFSNLNIDSYDC
jgi:hypothetical protein